MLVFADGHLADQAPMAKGPQHTSTVCCDLLEYMEYPLISLVCRLFSLVSAVHDSPQAVQQRTNGFNQ